MIIKINSTEARITTKTSVVKKNISSTKSFSDSLSQIEVTAVDNSGSKQKQDNKNKSKPKTAFAWGNVALEELEKIQVDLLVGGIPISRLQLLNEIISNIPVAIHPELNDILKDIKLRLSIELAKYES